MNRDLLQIIAAINARLIMIMDLPSLLAEAKELIRNQFELAQVKLFVMDTSGEVLVNGNHTVALSDEPNLVIQAAKAGEPLFDEDLQQFAIPLISHHSVIGVLELYCTQWRPLAMDDIMAVTIVANQLSVALGQAQARARETEEIERLRALMAFNVAFLDNIAHDLRTPLGSVTGWAKVILDGMDGEISDEVRQHMGIIYRSGMQLREMVDDVMVMMKAEAGQLPLDLEDVKLNPILDKVVAQTRYLIDPNFIQLSLHVPLDLPNLTADSQRLEHALRNLLTNCIAYTEKGLVLVTAQHEENSIKITLQDSDIAIETEKMDTFFEWNWRKHGKHSFSRRGAAFDLGVVISKKIIEMHGGTLNLEAQSMRGLTFTISLPLEH